MYVCMIKPTCPNKYIERSTGTHDVRAISTNNAIRVPIEGDDEKRADEHVKKKKRGGYRPVMTQENTHYLDLVDLGVVTAKKRRRFGRRRFEEDSHGFTWMDGFTRVRLPSVDGTRAYRGDTSYR
jgi:hypothetical protein